MHLLPAITWLAYAVPAYILWTLVFRVRYGFWPYAEKSPLTDLYSAVDFALALCLIGYSIWIRFGPPPEPISTAAGLAVWSLGAALRVWAIATLGPHWRIGQDTGDTRAEFVARGPYRLLKHPINAALIVVAVGQALMTGLDARAIFLLAFSAGYYVAQARVEERHWRRRIGGDAAPAGGVTR